jgi:hypothetical protein
LDWTADLAFVRDQIQWRVPVQGKLDPLALLIGGAALDRGVDNRSHATDHREGAQSRTGCQGHWISPRHHQRHGRY